STLFDYPTCKPRPGVARRLSAIIVRFCMHDDAAAHDICLAFVHAHTAQIEAEGRLTGAVRTQVGHVAGVAAARHGMAVRLVQWIEVATRAGGIGRAAVALLMHIDRKSTRLNSSHVKISYAVFCLKKNSTEILDR